MARYASTKKGVEFTLDEPNANGARASLDRPVEVLLHAIGDKAITMALNAFEYAAKANGTSGRRHRIEHAEVEPAGGNGHTA